MTKTRSPPFMAAVRCDGESILITETAFDFLCRALADGLFATDGDGREDQSEDVRPLSPALFRFHESQTTAVTGVVPKRIWIDAICINQQDLQGRSHQVAIMGQIYKNSIMTIVWLGKEAPHLGALWVLQIFAPAFLALGRAQGYRYLRAKNPDRNN